MRLEKAPGRLQMAWVDHQQALSIFRQRITKQRVEMLIDSYWSTTKASSMNPARVVFRVRPQPMPDRERGIQRTERATRWHSGPVFHDHSDSMLVLWQVNFTVHAVFHHLRCNVQTDVFKAHTAIDFATLLTAELLADGWPRARRPRKPSSRP